jgi:hypothetical protein
MELYRSQFCYFQAVEIAGESERGARWQDLRWTSLGPGRNQNHTSRPRLVRYLRISPQESRPLCLYLVKEGEKEGGDRYRLQIPRQLRFCATSFFFFGLSRAGRFKLSVPLQSVVLNLGRFARVPSPATVALSREYYLLDCICVFVSSASCVMSIRFSVVVCYLLQVTCLRPRHFVLTMCISDSSCFTSLMPNDQRRPHVHQRLR